MLAVNFSAKRRLTFVADVGISPSIYILNAGLYHLEVGWMVVAVTRLPNGQLQFESVEVFTAVLIGTKIGYFPREVGMGCSKTMMFF